MENENVIMNVPNTIEEGLVDLNEAIKLDPELANVIDGMDYSYKNPSDEATNIAISRWMQVYDKFLDTDPENMEEINAALEALSVSDVWTVLTPEVKSQAMQVVEKAEIMVGMEIVDADKKWEEIRNQNQARVDETINNMNINNIYNIDDYFGNDERQGKAM